MVWSQSSIEAAGEEFVKLEETTKLGRKKLTAEKPRVLRLETQRSQQHLFDLFTTPDFVYIVGMILSAFAIFLSFGTICGEKQTHTLSLLMSHPIRRPTLLFAKWMGGYI